MTSLSISSKVPASNSSSMRSRAVSLPAARWRWRRSSPPAQLGPPFELVERCVVRVHYDPRGLRLFPVLEEVRQADVGQRVLEELIDHLRRARADVGAHLRGLDDVNRMARAGDEHFGLERIVPVDLDDFLDEVHAGLADIVEAADERADHRRAGLRGEQRLRGREHERDVHLEAFARQRLARAHAVSRERHLDDDVLVDRGEVAAFAKHPLPVGGEHFGADGALHDAADLLHRLAIIAGLLRHQRRVRRHAVDDADVGQRLDFLDVACVYEKLHRLPLSRSPFTVYR